jgi:hypothetical protein
MKPLHWRAVQFLVLLCMVVINAWLNLYTNGTLLTTIGLASTSIALGIGIVLLLIEAGVNR